MRKFSPNKVDEAKARILLEYFLRGKLRADYTDRIRDEISSKEFLKALAYVQAHFPDELPLPAIASENIQTIPEYEHERAVLFSMIDAALPFDVEKKTFGQFSHHRAILAWQESQKDVQHLDLRELHAAAGNLGLREKFLTGGLHSEAWLTDLDMKRFLVEAGMKDRVTITRLDPLDIAMALHFAREDHKDSDQSYQVPLILNKGSTGNIGSQGSHWVYAVVTVDPAAGTVEVFYRDSLTVSSTQTEQLQALFNQAVNYNEVDRTGGVAKRYHALPVDRGGKTVDHQLAFDIVGEARQKDSWTCGYRAMRGCLAKVQQDAIVPLPVDTTKYDQLSQCGGTPEELRKAFYNQMLGTMVVPAERLEKAEVDKEAAFKGSEKAETQTLDEDYLEDYLNFVATVPAPVVGSNVPAAEMRDRLKLEAEAEKQYGFVKGKLVSEDDVLIVDITALFSTEDEALVNQGKAKALAKILNEQERGKVQVQFTNTAQLKEANYFDDLVAALDQVETISRFSTDTKAFPAKPEELLQPKEADLVEEAAVTLFDGALGVVEGRNGVMQFLEVEADPRGNLWSQLWAARFSNPSLYEDNHSAMGNLSLSSAGGNLSGRHADRVINPGVSKMGGRYLKGLLSFLQTNADFFRGRPGDFSYKALLVDVKSGPAPEELCNEYLQVLAEYLERPDSYFPFQEVHINVPFDRLSPEIFDSLKRVLQATAGHQNLTTVKLQIDKINKDLTQAQYKELLSLFKEQGLCTSFHVSGGNKAYDEKAELANVMATNHRNRNIKQRAKAPLSPVVAQEQDVTEKSPVLPSPVVGTKVRALKLEGHDFRKNLNVEVNVEVSVESQVESQYQLQTQLEQQVEQEIQVQQQQQNDIEDAQSGMGADQRIGKVSYTSDMRAGIQLLNALDAHVNSVVQRDIADDPTSNLGILWDLAVSENALPNSVRYLSPETVGKLNASPRSFAEGFSIDNLPPGFFLAKYVDKKDHKNDGFVLCYDETKYIENKNQSPLTASPVKNSPSPAWRGDLRQFLPDVSQYTSVEIAKFCGWIDDAGHISLGASASQTYRPEKLFEFMQGLNPDLAQEILVKHAWCLMPAAQATGERAAFQPGAETAALGDVLYHEGVEGVGILLDALKTLFDKDPEFYRHFKTNFIGGGRGSLMGLMSEEDLAIIPELANLTPAQKSWWTALVSQHIQNIGYADLATLYNGFKYFLEQWPEDLAFPQECPIKSTNNMLVSLDRLLATLGKVHSRNIRDQVSHLEGLDFGKEGAWYAGRWDDYHFFHPAMQLTGKEASPEHGYKVRYQDLLELKSGDLKSVNGKPPKAITAFHRFIGRANYIADDYQKYIGLLDRLTALEVGFQETSVADEMKVLLLPILALGTTGPRGIQDFNGAIFLGKIQELAHKDSARLQALLDVLADDLRNFVVQPNLAEITALIELLYENDSSNENIWRDIELYKKNVSEKTLQAMVVWQRNSDRISAKDFTSLYTECEKLDPDSISVLSKALAALKRDPGEPYDIDINLLKALEELKETPNYQEALNVLAALDLEKTNHRHFPTKTQLIAAFNGAKDADSPQGVFAAVANALPGCHFDRASALAVDSFDLDARLIEQIEAFNKVLTSFELDPWEVSRLTSQGGGEYFKERYRQLLEVDLNNSEFTKAAKSALNLPTITPDVAVKEGAKREIDKKIAGCLEGVYISPIANLCAKFPALSALQTAAFFPAPTDFSPDNIENLEAYKKHVEPLFQLLAGFKAKWGGGFALDFLLNSPRTMQFSVAWMIKIFDVIKEMDPHYVPTRLFDAIFSSNAFEDSDTAARLAPEFIKIIQMNLEMSQKVSLIQLISANPAMDVERLVKLLEYVKVAHPAVEQSVTDLLLGHFEAGGGADILNKTEALLALFDKQNDPVLVRLLEQLQDHSGVYNKLFDAINAIPVERQQAFLKVVAYANLLERKDKTPEEISQLDNAFMYLGRMAIHEEADFNALSNLFDDRPRPGLKKVQQYLALPPDERRQFIDTYELDPPGSRNEEGMLDKQFDMSTVHLRIDQIVDLTRDNPLFYAQREQLMDHMGYVNAVGRTHPLNVPGMGAEGNKYHKPAKDLRKSELRELITHYRKIIRDKGADPKTKQIAKLEFVALAREAMYRNTGMFAYSTQVLSLLNKMLQGGSVFSEIRTGEGKGLITALLVAYKWMEGDVDACSANMELAGRDLEEFNDFFDYLGSTSALVRTSSSRSDYQQANYSDVDNMALFLEQMQLSGEDMPEVVSLVLDEADFIVLDNTTDFRYSTNLDATYDPHENPNEWAYPIILAFVEQKEFFNKKCPKEQDIIDLREFVQNQGEKWKSYCPMADKKQLDEFKAKFANFSDEQLDRWIDSAYTASKMEQDVDFAVRDTTIIRDDEKVQVRMARVKVNHRVSEGASFSNGVQQFLHTRLNLYHHTLHHGAGHFPIEPEKTYLASMSAKNFIDYYLRGKNGRARGDVLGLTGTMGSKAERLEMHSNYGIKFYRIPPHKTLNRKDLDPVVAKREYKGVWPFGKKEKAQKAQFRAIQKRVEEAVQRGQPILLICDGVESSQALFFYLNKHLSTKTKALLQLHNGEQSVREAKVIENARKNGAITISTPMMGRGTDIKPENEEQGLYVIDTYIAPDRDYGQIIGRAGRNGMIGLSELLLSEEAFTKYGYSVPTNNEELLRVIQEIQAKMTQDKTEQRAERQVFSDIKYQFEEQYFEIGRLLKQDVREKLTSIGADPRVAWRSIQYNSYVAWESFLNEIDSRWNELLTEMRNELKTNPDQDKEALLAEKAEQLTTFANERWEKIHAKIGANSNAVFQKEYQQAWKRLKPTEELTEIPEVKIVEHREATKQLAKIAVEKESAMMDISSRPLDPTRFNADQAVLSVLGDRATDPALAPAAFAKEIRAIYQSAFGRAPADNETPQDCLRELLTKVLERYHQTFVGPYDGVLRGRLVGLHQQVMSAVQRFGSDQDKQLAYNVHQVHLQQSAVAENGHYIQNLMQSMYWMRDHGMLPKDADLTATGIFGHNDAGAVWTSLYNYASQKLAGYAGAWFKSSDREKALAAMRTALDNINNDLDTTGQPLVPPRTPQEKVAALIALVEEKSHRAMDKDQRVDVAKWRTSTLRNKDGSGSRFQVALDAIRAKAMVAATGLANKDVQATQVNFGAQVDALKAQLNLLKQRAGLRQVKGHPTIKAFNNDTELNRLIQSLDGQNKALSVNYQTLQAIQQRLQHYQGRFGRQLSDNRSGSENAFVHLFNNVCKRLETMDKALGHSVQRSESNTSQNTLHDNVQAAVQRLVKKDYVRARGIDTSAYAGLLRDVQASPEMKGLLASVLFEIQRHITLQLGKDALVDFDFTKVSYDPANGTLEVGAQYLDKEGFLHGLTLKIDDLQDKNFRAYEARYTDNNLGAKMGISCDPKAVNKSESVGELKRGGWRFAGIDVPRFTDEETTKIGAGIPAMDQYIADFIATLPDTYRQQHTDQEIGNWILANLQTAGFIYQSVPAWSAANTQVLLTGINSVMSVDYDDQKGLVISLQSSVEVRDTKKGKLPVTDPQISIEVVADFSDKANKPLAANYHLTYETAFDPAIARQIASPAYRTFINGSGLRQTNRQHSAHPPTCQWPTHEERIPERRISPRLKKRQAQLPKLRSDVEKDYRRETLPKSVSASDLRNLTSSGVFGEKARVDDKVAMRKRAASVGADKEGRKPFDPTVVF